MQPGNLLSKTETCHRHHAISHLFANDPELFHFFFTEDRKGLRWQNHQTTVRKGDYWLDKEKSILVRIAVDLWTESTRYSKMYDVYAQLADHRMEGFLRAMEFLYATRGCECQNCKQRLKH